MQDGVHRRQYARGARALRQIPAPERASAHQLRGEGAVERRGNSLARHVTDGDDEVVRIGGEILVKVAAKLPRGGEGTVQVNALQPFWRTCRQQRRLHPLREADFLL